MKTIIIWLFSQIATFIETSLTWKIYGDFSLTHFILASLFLLALFGLFGFATHNFGSGVESIAIGYKNSENRKDKINYYNYTRTTGYRVNHKNYTSQGTFTDTYRVNTRTGKEKLIGSKASDTRIFKENAK